MHFICNNYILSGNFKSLYVYILLLLLFKLQQKKKIQKKKIISTILHGYIQTDWQARLAIITVIENMVGIYCRARIKYL